MQEHKALILNIFVIFLLVILTVGFGLFSAILADYLVSTYYIEHGGKEYHDSLTKGPPSPGGPIAVRTTSSDITKLAISMLSCILGGITGVVVWRIVCLIFGVDIKKCLGTKIKIDS